MYIEEVAGISVYRERKKETESRIKKTKENLSRVKDLKDEIERQLLKLKRQVKSAERYEALKAEEKSKKGLLKAISWQTRKEKISNIDLSIKELESSLEKERTLKISLNSEIDKSKVTQSEIQQKIDCPGRGTGCSHYPASQFTIPGKFAAEDDDFKWTKGKLNIRDAQISSNLRTYWGLN